MKLIVMVLFIFLAGCSSLTFTSNANTYLKNKVEKGIRSSAVTRYTNAEVWQLRASQLGYVETDYCQVDMRELKPSNDSLITELEVQVQQLGGNGLVFDSCSTNNNTARCHSYTKCQGMAFLVPN